MFTCPVCFYGQLEEAPTDYNICECCGTEFGNDDCDVSHDELRSKWIENGANWFFGDAPAGWNPWFQMFAANVSQIPYSVSVTLSGGHERRRATKHVVIDRIVSEIDLAYAS